MDRLKELLSKYGGVISCVIMCILLLFSMGCSIYTAIENVAIGVCGLIGSTLSLGIFGWLGWCEIRDIRKARKASKK